MLHFSILILAATLTSVAVAQFVAAGYSVSRTQRRFRSRRFQTLKTLRNAAEIARVESELQVSAASAGGLGWRVMEIAQWVDESADCR